MSDTALQQAQQIVQTLQEANQTGKLTGFMLKTQLEELATMLARAQAEQAAAREAAAAAPPALADYIREEAHFVGHAVHQIRNKLTPVKGYVDMMTSMGALTDMQKQFMEPIRSNVNRAITLLADVGMINKINKGVLKTNAKIDTFRNLGLRIEKEMRPIAEAAGCTLEFDIPSGLPILNIDGDLLVTLVNKLVENGILYAPEQGRVRVTASAEDSTLVIVIEDNGIGMTPEEQSHLGEIYFRSDSEVVQQHRGSGLGIPIAFGLARLMNISIQVDSQPGAGTRITLRVPGMTA